MNARALSPAEHRWIEEAAQGDAEVAAEMIRRWEAGEPLQYVLGGWAFRQHELACDPRALIPRPETEWLVEVALRLAPQARCAVDLGTGTGAIALALWSELDAAEVWAVERSPEAAALARTNLRETEVTLLEGSWFEPLPADLRGRVDLLVSNPPYVSEAEWEDLDPVVRDHEPRDALVPGPSGLESYEQILGDLDGWLAAGGVVLFECAPHQTAALAAMCEKGGLTGAAVHTDLAGRQRMVSARSPGSVSRRREDRRR